MTNPGLIWDDIRSKKELFVCSTLDTMGYHVAEHRIKSLL